jgi:hypothetical protein
MGLHWMLTKKMGVRARDQMSHRNEGRFGCHGDRDKNAQKVYSKPKYKAILGESRTIPMPSISLAPNNKQ